MAAGGQPPDREESVNTHPAVRREISDRRCSAVLQYCLLFYEDLQGVEPFRVFRPKLIALYDNVIPQVH